MFISPNCSFLHDSLSSLVDDRFNVSAENLPSNSKDSGFSGPTEEAPSDANLGRVKHSSGDQLKFFKAANSDQPVFRGTISLHKLCWKGMYAPAHALISARACVDY